MGTARKHQKALNVTAALVLLAAFFSGCATPESGQSEAVRSFKKEVKETRDALVPALMDAVANRDPQSVGAILGKQCVAAGESGRPFSCGIAVLDLHGITLHSVTPGEPIKRIDYSSYNAVKTALKEKKVVKTRAFLQDHTTLYEVNIPLVRNGEAIGILVLAFDASDLRNRYHLTEEEFLKIDLDG
jgi:hypothetical protein